MESSSSRRDISSASYDPFHYHQDGDERSHRHRHRHRHLQDPMLDSSSSVGSEARFSNGSNHAYDQPPSPQVRKRLAYDEQDHSERSFQLGVDPIERDWGDSISRHSYRGKDARAPMNNARYLAAVSQQSNASFKYRSVDEQSYYVDEPGFRRYPSEIEEEPSYCGEAADSVYGETMANRPGHHRFRNPSAQPRREPPRQYSSHHRLANSSHYRRVASANPRYNPHQSYSDRAGARPPTPENVHRHHHRSFTAPPYASKDRGFFKDSEHGDRRFSSNVSVSGSSVCSRSAPIRRTPIPREPSLYQPHSPSVHSHKGGGQRRTFEFRRRRSFTERRQYSAYYSMPPEQVDHIIDASQHSGRRHTSRAAGLTPAQKKSTHSSHSGSSSGAIMVDIAPGVQVRLRGTQETYTAVSKDFYNNVSCLGCSKELCCIADVSFIVCPECKVVSPLEGCLFEGKEIQRHGLGLGFSYDGLFQMQVEIMKDRKP